MNPKGCQHKKRKQTDLKFNYFYSWVSAATGICAFIFYLPGIFVEHSVVGTEEEVEEKDSVPKILEPMKKPRELLKQLSRISVVNGSAAILTFNETSKAATKTENVNFFMLEPFKMHPKYIHSFVYTFS